METHAMMAMSELECQKTGYSIFLLFLPEKNPSSVLRTGISLDEFSHKVAGLEVLLLLDPYHSVDGCRRIAVQQLIRRPTLNTMTLNNVFWDVHDAHSMIPRFHLKESTVFDPSYLSLEQRFVSKIPRPGVLRGEPGHPRHCEPKWVARVAREFRCGMFVGFGDVG